jgi:hypothetical protein
VRQGDGFGGRLDAGALAAGVAFDHHRQRPAGNLGRLGQARDHGRIVGGHRDRRLGLQRAEPRHFFFADQVITDQDVLDSSLRHHFGFAEFLAGDTAGAGGDLQFCQ